VLHCEQIIESNPLRAGTKQKTNITKTDYYLTGNLPERDFDGKKASKNSRE
jgi:hypothetical protein